MSVNNLPKHLPPRVTIQEFGRQYFTAIAILEEQRKYRRPVLNGRSAFEDIAPHLCGR